MDQMNVSITDKLASYVRKKVRSGRYNNASEVVRDALRRMEEDDVRALRLAEPTAEALVADLTEQQLQVIRGQVRKGIQSIEAGRFKLYEDSEELRQLSEGVKMRGRKRLGPRNSRPIVRER